MTKKLFVVLLSIMVIGVFALTAGKGPGDGTGTCIFIDENGDGINDNFRDHDGDGIPNHDDPDWVRPQDGTGYGAGNGAGNGKMNRVRNQNKINGAASFNSFQYLNNFGGNFGTGICDGTGTDSTNGNGKRKKGGRG